MIATDLAAQIAAQIEILATSTDVARRSEQFQTFAKFAGSFYHYSMGNVMLIAIQRPDATMVAGFNAWKKKNRMVRKGEHGIAILAPCPYERDGEEKVYFRTAYVFDIAQTEGDPIPETPDWKSVERRAELEEKLLVFATAQGITVTRDEDSSAQGRANVREKSIRLKPNAGTETLVHEIAHIILEHNHETGGTNTREIQAEAVGYIVCSHFGLDAAAKCANYLAHFATNAADIKAELTEITRASSAIIRAVEDTKQKEVEE